MSCNCFKAYYIHTLKFNKSEHLIHLIPRTLYNVFNNPSQSTVVSNVFVFSSGYL